MDDDTSVEVHGADVWMIHPDLTRAPTFTLPVSYRMRAYRAGDVETWVRIQQAGDPFFRATAQNFVESMPGDTAYLAARVLFLVDESGADIGTIAAWNDTEFDGREIGHTHWVAIVATAQGRGLAKPMLSARHGAPLRHG